MSNWLNEILDSKAAGIHWVNSYIREDGEFVEGHFRSNPNDLLSDNLSDEAGGNGMLTEFYSDLGNNTVDEHADFGLATILEELSNLLFS